MLPSLGTPSCIGRENVVDESLWQWGGGWKQGAVSPLGNVFLPLAPCACRDGVLLAQEETPQGVRWRQKRSPFLLAVATECGHRPQGDTVDGTHGKDHWPWCMTEVYWPPSWWGRSFIQLEVKLIVSQASWLYWEWSLLVILQALESLQPIWHWVYCEHHMAQPFNDGLGWLVRKWGLCQVSYWDFISHSITWLYRYRLASLCRWCPVKLYDWLWHNL